MLDKKTYREIYSHTPFDIIYPPNPPYEYDMSGMPSQMQLHMKYELTRRKMIVGIHFMFTATDIEAHVDFRQK